MTQLVVKLIVADGCGKAVVVVNDAKELYEAVTYALLQNDKAVVTVSRVKILVE